MPRNDALLARTTRTGVAGPRALDPGPRADRRAGPAAALPQAGVLGGAVLDQPRGRGRDGGLHPQPAAAGHRRGAAGGADRRLPRGPGAVAARAPGGGGGRAGGGRALHRPAAGGLQGRAGPADAGVQRDAGPAAPGGRGAQGVRGHRLARAAHADLLARAASWSCCATRTWTRRPGASSWTPRSSRPSGCRSWRWTCWTSRAWTPGRSSSTARGSTCRRWRWRSSASSSPPCSATTPGSRCASRPGYEPPATGKGWLRSCVSCSTMRCATRPRART